METGTPWRKGTASAAGSTGSPRRLGSVGGSPFRAVSMTPELPRSLYGDEPALAVDDLSDFQRSAGAARWHRSRRELGFDLEDALRGDAEGS